MVTAQKKSRPKAADCEIGGGAEYWSLGVGRVR
jgi:hypothetical protein